MASMAAWLRPFSRQSNGVRFRASIRCQGSGSSDCDNTNRSTVDVLTDDDVDTPDDMTAFHGVQAAPYYFALESKYGAHNYEPLPIVLARGMDVHVWDVHGQKYLDFLSAYSAVNQGHCHPNLVGVLRDQAQKLTLTSRAFFNDKLGEYERFMCDQFGYDKLLPMNTGVEAVESAIKMARKWGYLVKNIAIDEARVVFCSNNFWGRSLAAVSSSSDPVARADYGPFLPNFDMIPYNDVGALKSYLENHGHVTAAVCLEPIQGEAGIIVPTDGYLTEVRRLCEKHDVLMIADEVQTGLGRTGYMLAVEYESVRPDMVCLGKALSGGMLPVSAVLGDSRVLGLLKPGQHGSTYGGNPLACAVATEAVKVLLVEDLAENAQDMGNLLRSEMHKALLPTGLVKEIRGRGLMNAIVVDDSTADPGLGHSVAWDLCLRMAGVGTSKGLPTTDEPATRLLAKPTHGNVIRLAPPLTITADQVANAVEIMYLACKGYLERK